MDPVEVNAIKTCVRDFVENRISLKEFIQLVDQSLSAIDDSSGINERKWLRKLDYEIRVLERFHLFNSEYRIDKISSYAMNLINESLDAIASIIREIESRNAPHV